jgi:hypothetical protein
MFAVRGSGVGMTSNRDDLEEALRQNLELRRELQTEIAKASERRRSGWGVLCWVGLVLIPVLILWGLALPSVTLFLMSSVRLRSASAISHSSI